jgi:hypothetical protein
MATNGIWMLRVWAFVLLGMATLIGLGCVSSTSASDGPGIGTPCNSDSACSTSVVGAYCAKSGVCTRTCTLHSDCGCAGNTTNGDLSSGKCGFACINEGSGGICLKVCANNAQCFGSQSCNSTGHGYSVCSTL